MKPTITLTGNVVVDPELRFTPSGKAVCNFRIAHTPRVQNQQTQQWEDGESAFYNVAVWNRQAENVQQTINKGMRVIVSGVASQRGYTTKEGEQRISHEIRADVVAPSLEFATAVVSRNPKDSGNGQGGTGFQAQGQQMNQSAWNQAPQSQPFPSEEQPPF